jgi:hypothetical protein
MYERFFSGIFSPEEVYFKLRAIKWNSKCCLVL